MAFISPRTNSQGRLGTNESTPKQRRTSMWTNKTGEILNRKSLAKAATILPTEDKFQKLKNVKLAGFSFVARTTNWYARFFWIILILAAFAFCIYEVYRTIVDFIENPIITTYVLEPLDEIELPSLFVCLSTVVNARFLEAYRSEASAMLKMMQAMSSVTNDATEIFNADDDIGAEAPAKMSGVAYERHFKSMGFEVDQVFLSCQFFTNSSEWEKLSCPDIVTPLIDHRFGKCFRVSMGKNQTTEGKALSLVISSRSKSGAVNESLIMKPYEGAYITIDSSYQPLSNDRYLVSAGAYTKMALKLTTFELLNLPSGAIVQPCLDNSGSGLRILNTSYTPSSCRFECSLIEILQVCKCLPLLDKSIIRGDLLNSTKFCGSEEYTRCISANVSISGQSKNAIKDCKEHCLPNCKNQRYEASSSSAPLNPAAFTHYSSNAAYVDELIWLEVAFNRLEKSVFTQSSSMTFDFFVGNMGSQVTLWIGGSMLTLLPLPLSLLAFCFMAGLVRIKKIFKGRTIG